MIRARRGGARRPRVRRLPALAAAASLLAALAAAPAAAGEVYGGLGPVGTTIKSGTAGGHGEVNPGGQVHGHAFAVDTKTGDLFTADEVTVVESGHNHVYARIQEFSPTGEFLAENRIKLKLRKEEEQEVIAERVGGLAVDPEHGHVYLLLAEQRREYKLEIEEKLAQVVKESKATEREIEETETKLTKAKNKGEPTAQLEAELKALKEKLTHESAEETKLEKEEEALDAEFSSAAELYSFSTEANNRDELKEEKLIADSELLKSASEEQRASLLAPSGIAVDPKTGDVLILGQQNEAATPAEGADVRAAVQRVHVNGTLGPRYVDKANCLDGGSQAAAEKEPKCGEDEEEFPTSPVVTPGGRLYAQVGVEELWEIPVGAEAEKGFEEVEATPRFLAELDGSISEPKIVKGTLAEEEGGTLSFVPGKTATEGTIYMRAQIPNAGQNGVVRWHYSEGGAEPEATEEGWTGGQEKNSPQVKCVVRGESDSQPLIAGGSGEQVLMLSYLGGSVTAFGPGAGAEACGHEPKVTPPSIEVDAKPAVEAGVGQPVKLSSGLSGARATSTTWKFKYKDPTSGETHEEEVTTPYAIQDPTVLTQAFEHEGAYEITEIVHTDELAYPTITAEPVKLQVLGIKAPLALPEMIAAHEQVAIQASVTDRVEAPLHLKAVWSFGDNTQPVEQKYEGASPLRIEVKHTFATPGQYELTLEIKDESGGHKTVTESVTVNEDQAEKEAREAQEAQERKEREQKEREAIEAKEREAKEREAREQNERATHEREAREKTEREAHERAEAEAKKKKEEEERAKDHKPPTRAQLLAKALKECKKQPKSKRAKCEATARKRYASKTHGRKKKHKK